VASILARKQQNPTGFTTINLEFIINLMAMWSLRGGGPASCNPTTTNLNATAADGSGALLTTYGTTAVITYTNGQVVTAPINVTAGAASMTDRNGNQISVNSSGQFFDSLSSSAAVLTVTGSGTVASPIKFTYTPPSNTPVSYVMNYTNYTVATNFALSGIAEYRSGAAVPLVSSVVLPDGSQYTFTYEPTPSTPSSGACTPYAGTTCVTSRVAIITLRTGGQTKYTYSGGAGNGIFSDGSAATLTRATPDGQWIYAQVKGTGAASTTTVTDPQSNVTAIQFQGIYETKRQVNQGSSPLLLTTNTCYNGAASPCTPTAITLPITQRATISILPNNQESEHIDSYDPSSSVLIQSDDYDYGATPGPLLKRVVIKYASLGNITAFPQLGTVCNGSGTASVCNGKGTVVSQITYNYDEATPTASAGTPQHVAVTGSRGNLTSITYPSGTNSQSKNTYYDTGMLLTATDSNGAVTTYSYAGSSCGNAFPTSVTEPLSMSRSFAWNNCAGSVMSQLTDENGNVTTTTYNDPYFWRPASQSYPDTGSTSWTYTSPAITTSARKMNSTQNVTTYLLTDGLGRQSQVQLTSDPLGTVTTYMNYDSLGRVASIYNPTRCSPPYTNCGESTWGYTTTSYDALSRITSVQYQDGSTATTSYVNNTETVTDQAGKTRKFQFDGLGRVTNVWEDPAGLMVQTVYTYDALGDLTGVVQAGSHNRTYIYDGLSRLTSKNNPESGFVSYTYNTNGDLATKVAPAPNQTGTTTVTTTYTFDLLHRLTKKAYSDGTPTASFLFDSGFVPGGATPHNTLGRLVTAQTPITDSAFSYDAMGRPVWNVQATPQNCCSTGWTLNYSYDLMGNMLSASNGFGTTLSYTYDGAARPKALTSSLVDSQHPAAIFTADATNGYFPHGALRKGAFGNGLTQSNVYDKSLNPCLLDVDTSNSTLLQTCGDSVPSGNVLDLAMGYNAGTSNNGNIVTWTATGAQSFARTYGYDSLNRVSTMGDTVSAQPCRGLSWTYDNWGNRSAQSMTAGTSCNTFNDQSDANNHLLGSPYTYDAAGNMTHDASHSYTYDSESRLTAVDGGNTANYYYDAFGYRVHHLIGSSTMEYVRDLHGNVVSEILPSGGLNASYMYFGGQLIAEYSAGTTYFIHQDHLGSTRLVTAYPSASIAECDDYYPYGEANANVGTCLSGTTTHYKFTADELDPESNLDNTQYRKYSSSVARWMTPDPAGLAAVNPSNPQSWNRYGYVGNSPLRFIDRTGQVTCPSLASNACALAQYQPHLGGDLWGVNSSSWDEFDLTNIPVYSGYGWIPWPDTGVTPVNTDGTGTTLVQTYDYWGPIQVGTAFDLFGGGNTTGYIKAATDVAGIAGLFLREKVAMPMARFGAAISILNDPSPTNIMTNVLGLIPGFEGPMAITGAFNDFLDYGINNSTPGPKKVYDQDQLGPALPQQDGGCLAAGLGSC
jgi:RHS repeat-associated protein